MKNKNFGVFVRTKANPVIFLFEFILKSYKGIKAMAEV